MATTSADHPAITSDESRLVIDAALLDGLWTEEQYCRLTDQTNTLIEFVDGTLEVLPVPTYHHQALCAALLFALAAVVKPVGAIVSAPLRVRLRLGLYREPDVVALRHRDDPRFSQADWHGADLVVEIISPGGETRDTVHKRHDYATAGIAEYWLVDPVAETITVLTLRDGTYATHLVAGRGHTATSLVFRTLAVDAAALFDTD